MADPTDTVAVRDSNGTGTCVRRRADRGRGPRTLPPHGWARRSERGRTPFPPFSSEKDLLIATRLKPNPSLTDHTEHIAPVTTRPGVMRDLFLYLREGRPGRGKIPVRGGGNFESGAGENFQAGTGENFRTGRRRLWTYGDRNRSAARRGEREGRPKRSTGGEGTGWSKEFPETET